MNYGWAGMRDSFSTWYALDNLYYPAEGDLSEEKMLIGIRPNSNIGSMGWFDYSGYSYVTRDFVGGNAHFNPGSRIQFLTQPATVLGASANSVRIDGAPSAITKLYAIDETQGIVITNASIIINNGGGIQMIRERPGIYDLR